MSLSNKLNGLTEISNIINTRVEKNDPLYSFKKEIIDMTEKLNKSLTGFYSTAVGMAKRELKIGSDDPSPIEILDDILFSILNDTTHIEVNEKDRTRLSLAKKDINRMTLLLGAYADALQSFSKRFLKETKDYNKKMYNLLVKTK